MDRRSAVSKINKNGSLLVFPINNQKEPRSLWSEFYPRTKMRWEWDEGGDNRVGNLWLLMKDLSDSKQVVYSKWYQGRATFFSRELFTALLAVINQQAQPRLGLSPTSKHLLETLESDSPLSTKQLKALTDLQGKFNESTYTRSMKELFSRLLVVAFGEVEDGAFPSLAVGATSLIYEDLVEKARQLSLEEATKIINRYWDKENPFRLHFKKQIKKLVPTEPGEEAYL